MGPADRLQILFAQDKEILQINTGLRSVTMAVAKAVEQPSADQTPTPPEDPETCPHPSQIPVMEDEKTPAALPESAPAPHDGTFCPLTAASRFPYHHIRGDLMQRVAGKFFDKGQFWDRPWDLYYIYTPPCLGGRALVVVPAAQVRGLLRDINAALECSLSLPSNEEKGLMLRFNREGFPQPIFLGRSDNRATKDYLEASIPQTSSFKVSPETTAEQLLAFEKMMEAGITSAKSKSRSKAKKLRLRYQRELEMGDAVRRAQCYLGLRAESADLIECNWDEKAGPEPEPKPLTLGQPAPHPFWTEPVFISIDVEVNERCHTLVTEVGISILDTRDLIGVAPGPQAEAWQSRIQSRHLRVEEYKNHVNQLYVRGCPDKFEFGTSEFIPAETISKTIQDSFSHPSFFFFSEPDKKPRPLVLVGHSLAADIQYLELANVHIVDEATGTSKFADQIDTAASFQIIRGEIEARSLGAVIAELGMTGWNLHNAGNDARYTMQALVAMLVMHSMEQASEPQ